MVSVILSCYNGAAFLDEAIVSVLAQSYNNLELIFVDDGSTDASYSVAAKYAATDKRVRLFQKENGGLNSARNFGAENASPDSLALLFFDADDCMHEEMIMELHTALYNHKEAGAAYCKLGFMNNEGVSLNSEQPVVRLYPSTFWVKELKPDTVGTPFYSIYSWTSMPEACTLIKKEIFFKYGAWDNVNFSKGNTYGESVPLFGEIALNHSIVFVDKILYRYRRHSNQITSGIADMKIIQSKIDKIMLGKARQAPLYLDRIKRAINFNQYRLPLYKYLKGSFRYELRHHSLRAFNNLFVAGVKYFISIPLFIRK